MQRTGYRLLLALVFASLLLFFADRQNAFYWPRFGVQIVVNPVERGLYSAKVFLFDSVSFLTFWRSGEERIKNLEQRNWELTSKQVVLESLLRENEAMRKQLGTSVPQGKKLLPAPVLGMNQVMEIGVGSNERVRKGMSVTLAGNLVGRVDRVLPHSAMIMMPTDGYSRIPVAIGSVRAVAVGSFGSKITLEKVGQTDQIQVEDLVVTSGEGDSYYPGLVVGRIAKITGKETDLFRQAEVVPLLDFAKLGTVFVVTN